MHPAGREHVSTGLIKQGRVDGGPSFHHNSARAMRAASRRIPDQGGSGIVFRVASWKPQAWLRLLDRRENSWQSEQQGGCSYQRLNTVEKVSPLRPGQEGGVSVQPLPGFSSETSLLSPLTRCHFKESPQSMYTQKAHLPTLPLDVWPATMGLLQSTQQWAGLRLPSAAGFSTRRFCPLGTYDNVWRLFKKYLTALGLSCDTWDLVSWPGIKPRSLQWKCGVLATRSPGKSLSGDFFKN